MNEVLDVSLIGIALLAGGALTYFVFPKRPIQPASTIDYTFALNVLAGNTKEIFDALGKIQVSLDRPTTVSVPAPIVTPVNVEKFDASEIVDALGKVLASLDALRISVTNSPVVSAAPPSAESRLVIAEKAPDYTRSFESILDAIQDAVNKVQTSLVMPPPTVIPAPNVTVEKFDASEIVSAIERIPVEAESAKLQAALAGLSLVIPAPTVNVEKPNTLEIEASLNQIIESLGRIPDSKPILIALEKMQDTLAVLAAPTFPAVRQPTSAGAEPIDVSEIVPLLQKMLATLEKLARPR